MASYTRQALLVLKRIAIVIGIAIAFSLGLLGAIYLSLRSSETRVPDIVGKDRAAAENTISDAGLNFRVRALRASAELIPADVRRPSRSTKTRSPPASIHSQRTHSFCLPKQALVSCVSLRAQYQAFVHFAVGKQRTSKGRRA